MKYTWCQGWEENEYTACLKWICQCGHAFKKHKTIPPHKCRICACKKEIYGNNNDCTIECQFYRKVYETEIK